MSRRDAKSERRRLDNARAAAAAAVLRRAEIRKQGGAPALFAELDQVTKPA